MQNLYQWQRMTREKIGVHADILDLNNFKYTVQIASSYKGNKQLRSLEIKKAVDFYGTR